MENEKRIERLPTNAPWAREDALGKWFDPTGQRRKGRASMANMVGGVSMAAPIIVLALAYQDHREEIEKGIACLHRASDSGTLIVLFFAGVIVMGLFIRWKRQLTRRQDLVRRGEMPESLVKETGGEAYAYRLLLLVEGFNELVELFEQRDKATELGMRAPLANRTEILTKLQAVRARLERGAEIIELMRRTQASEARRELGEGIFKALGLADEATGVRVAIDPIEAHPDADDDLRAGLREAEAALRGG